GLETITPTVRLLPPARLRACRLGWYFNSSMAFTTRARVEVLTTVALLSTRETVAVETLARRATCSRFMTMVLLYLPGRRWTASWAIRSRRARCPQGWDADGGSGDPVNRSVPGRLCSGVASVAARSDRCS